MRLAQIAADQVEIRGVIMKQLSVWALWFLASFLLVGCDGKGRRDSTNLQPVFHAQDNPERLSEWGMLSVADERLQLANRVVPYDLNTPLFSDYAQKLRTVWTPGGMSAKYDAVGTFSFPVGTVITKTFYYPLPSGSTPSGGAVLRSPDNTNQLLNSGFSLDSIKLIETRILVHRADGWVALPYVWNDEQTDAVLQRTGDIKNLELVDSKNGRQAFSYVVPNTNQCAGCHATNSVTREMQPIGPKARHLNKDYQYKDGPKNQLASWQVKGLLKGVPEFSAIPQNALWNDTSIGLDKRARSYLDINCSHCHNRKGSANTSGLLLEPDSPTGFSLGVCKLPIAAGTGTGDRKFGIVPGKPDESIFIYRMASTNPEEMMPELGRSVSHDEGVALIRQWIAGMRGACS
jgi:uncharacterized repeat protein (TIGR03806 family)